MSAHQISLDLAPVIIPGHPWQEKLRKVCPYLPPIIPATRVKKRARARRVSFNLNPTFIPASPLESFKKTRRVASDLTPHIMSARTPKKMAQKVHFNLVPEVIPDCRMEAATGKVSFDLNPTIVNPWHLSGKSKACRVTFDLTPTIIEPQNSKTSKTKLRRVTFDPVPAIIQSSAISTARVSFYPVPTIIPAHTPEEHPHVTFDPILTIISPQHFSDTGVYSHPSHSSSGSDNDVDHGSDYGVDHDSDSTLVASGSDSAQQHGVDELQNAANIQGYEGFEEPLNPAQPGRLRQRRELGEAREIAGLAARSGFERGCQSEDEMRRVEDRERIQRARSSVRRTEVSEGRIKRVTKLQVHPFIVGTDGFLFAAMLFGSSRA